MPALFPKDPTWRTFNARLEAHFPARMAVWLDAAQAGVIALERTHGGEVILILANVTEAEVTLDGRYLPPINPRGVYTDPLSGESLRPGTITLNAYGMVWLQYP
ncbi:MAG TPA: alpha-glucosidase C-terminal domain-containing protein [Aggregatilineales bacterium]|nr:alpha-glucosidase C-terminal domain-containing protein [Anaerolineales bacterium]HRE47300.1 alpha-glucosidase C-terminal domain-containing protein [Aggregatilineales bacterium]